MKRNWWKLLVVVVLVIVVGVVLAAKNRDSGGKTPVVAESTVDATTDSVVEQQTQETADTDVQKPEKPVAEPAKAEESKPDVVARSSPGVAANPAPKTRHEATKPKPAQETKPKPVATADQKSKQLPKLLDLGATKCIPCKMMVPVLDELTKEYRGKLTVEFIDVWENQAAAEKYKVQSIPTQIFFDAKGEEVYRHVGFFSKEDILKTFDEYGIKLD